MTMLVPNWPAFIASRTAYIRATMVDEFYSRKRRLLYPTVFNVRGSSRYAEETNTVAGLGLAQEILTEVPDSWPTDDFTPRFSKTFTHGWFANGMVFSKPFLMNDVDRFGAQRSREIMASMWDTVEYWTSQVLANMNDDTNYPVPDGEALADDAHPLLDNVIGGSATFDNWIDATLDHDSLQDAHIVMGTMVNQRGKPISFTTSRVIISPHLAPTISELMNSELRSDTAENAYNTLRDYRPQILPWHYLQSPTFWALQADSHGLVLYMRQSPMEEVEGNFHNKSIEATADMFFSTGAEDWPGIVGGSD